MRLVRGSVTRAWCLFLFVALLKVSRVVESIDSNKRNKGMRFKAQMSAKWGHNSLLEPSGEIELRFICSQAEALVKVDLNTRRATEITKTIFSALKATTSLRNRPRIHKLLSGIDNLQQKAKGAPAGNFFHFKTRRSVLVLRNILCSNDGATSRKPTNDTAKFANSPTVYSRPNVFLKSVHMQGKQPQGGFFRFQERHQHEGNGLSSAGVGDNSENYEKVPFYAGTMCVNQVDGSVCGSTPFAVCCRQRCVSPRTFSFMCPRLCPVTANDGESCGIDKPSQNTTSHNFCCSKSAATKEAIECFNERQYELQCPQTPPKPKEWAFSPEPDAVEKFFSETKAYWADRKKWNPCESQEDGASCATDATKNRISMFCCRKLCMTENAMKVQCPLAFDNRNDTSVDKYKSPYHHNASQPVSLTNVDRTERRAGFMPKPYFARGNNLTISNRVPPPLVSMPPTEPGDEDLHPVQTKGHAAVILDGDEGEGIGVKEKIGLPKQAARVVEAPSNEHVGDMPTKIAGVSSSNNNKMIRSMSDIAAIKPNVGRQKFEPRSFQEYDPYPTANPVCPVSYITVKREDTIIDGITPKDVAQHIGRYTGIWDVHADNKFVQAQLYAPSRLPYVNTGEHFFADLDGRYTFAAMTTPGGDMGEFIGAMCALEKTRHKGTRLLTLSDVRNLFHSFLKTYGEERRKFFMQTDAQAMAAFEKAVGVPGFLTPEKIKMLDKEDVQIIIKMAAIPEHVGSSHLRSLLSFPAEYGCRSDLTEYAITVFFELLLATNNALSNKLTYHVAQGYHEESAVVSVYTLEDECPEHVPLVVAGVRDDADGGDTPVTSVFMLYPSAVYALRQELANLLQSQVRSKLRGKEEDLLVAINEVAEHVQERTLMRMAPNLPRFATFFTKSPF